MFLRSYKDGSWLAPREIGRVVLCGDELPPEGFLDDLVERNLFSVVETDGVRHASRLATRRVLEDVLGNVITYLANCGLKRPLFFARINNQFASSCFSVAGRFLRGLFLTHFAE